MSYKLVIPKRLLTYYSNKLETILTRFKEDGLESVNLSGTEGDPLPSFIRDSLQRLEDGAGAIEAAISKTERQLQDYATELANLTEDEPKDNNEFEVYSTKAQESLTLAFDYMLQLQVRIQAFRSYASNPQVPQNLPSRSSDANIVNESAFSPKQLELLALPIPKFSGNIWE
ncbi:hypothetical protein RB195_025122 [Necator americanus]|uniref:Uncharacterized protein n=1 Tax=Necator americanus TaxID=51031 RepID=A0ABR1ER09_NECAM